MREGLERVPLPQDFQPLDLPREWSTRSMYSHVSAIQRQRSATSINDRFAAGSVTLCAAASHSSAWWRHLVASAERLTSMGRVSSLPYTPLRLANGAPRRMVKIAQFADSLCSKLLTLKPVFAAFHAEPHPTVRNGLRGLRCI